MNFIYYIGILISGLLLFFTVVILFIRRYAIKLEEEYKSKQFATEEILFIDNGANLFGIDTLNSLQLRGNGLLIITEDSLFFRLFFPKKEIKIEMKRVFNIEFIKSFKGKSILRLLTKIDYNNNEGSIDSIVLYIKEKKKLKETIENIIYR